MCKKNFIPISISFCVIALQIYREILKKYRKRAITLEKSNFSKIKKKTVLDIHTRNVMPKYQSCRLNGVATIAKTYTHKYIHIPNHPTELMLYFNFLFLRIRGDWLYLSPPLSPEADVPSWYGWLNRVGLRICREHLDLLCGFIGLHTDQYFIQFPSSPSLHCI